MPEMMEAPIEDVAVDTGIEETPEIESSSESTEGDTPTNDDSDLSQDDGTELSGSKLWNASKEKLKELDPKLARAINKAIHKADSLSKKYPEGFDHIDGTLAAVKQLADDPSMPTERIISEAVAERSFFRELDNLYTSNPKGFLDKIIDPNDPVSVETFQHAAPEFFNKFSELNPDGFASYVSRVTTGYLDSQGIPTQFALLRTFLPMLPADNPATKQIQDAFEKIYGMTENLRNFAKNPINPERKTQAEAPKQGEDYQQREMNLTAREWNTEIQQSGINMVHSEAAKYSGKQKLTDQELRTVVSKVSTEMEAILMAKKGYGEAMHGYLQAGNKAAFHQRLQSERKQLVPAATRRAVEDVLASRPKAVSKPTGNTPTKDGQKPLQGAPQAQRIAGHPKTLGWQVDLNRTPHHLLLKNQAYVVGKQGLYTWPAAKR